MEAHSHPLKKAPWNPCKRVIEGHSRKLSRSLYQRPTEAADISTAPQPRHNRATTRAIRHAQSAEGCTSSVKIRTAPQRERSDKVPRRLCESDEHFCTALQRERSASDSHMKVARAIAQIRTAPQRERHAQSAERVARAIAKFAPRHNESDPTRPKSREGCGRTR